MILADDSFETIRVEREGPVAVLTMSRPAKLNAFNIAMLREMRRAIEAINADESVRIAILTGEGRSFSAGADLSDRSAAALDVTQMLEQEYRPPLMAITHAEKPWISAVAGAAAGIGSAFAMNCDLTVMAEDAYLYQAFTAIGLVPDGGATWHLARTVGRKRAFELIATGEKLRAARCLELGLCNRVVPAASLMEETLAWSGELAERAPLSLRYAKKAVMTAVEEDLGAAFSTEAMLQAKCIASEDAQEGARAFFEKRPPHFKGR